MLGLYAFMDGCLHLLTYVWLYADFSLAAMIDDITKRRFITAGLTAWVLMVPLALTSTTWSIRKLGGKNWNRLHRNRPISPIAGVVHYWWGVKPGVLTPTAITAVLTVLLVARPVLNWWSSRKSVPLSDSAQLAPTEKGLYRRLRSRAGAHHASNSTPCLFRAGRGCIIFGHAQARKTVPAPSRHATVAPLPPLTDQERAIQMLSRFTFGPRPGDVEAVAKMGPDAWFEQQLNPDSIPDPVVDKRLADYPSLYLPPNQLLVEFPSNQIIRQITDGKRSGPPDPMLEGAYEVLLAKYSRRQAEQKAQQNAAPGMTPGMSPDMTADMSEASKSAQRKQQQAAAQVLADQVLAFPKGERVPAIMKMPVEQRITLTEFVPDPQRGLLFNDFTPREREIFPDGRRPRAAHVVDDELMQAKVVRAILSERQLQEVMTDFWFNHFNVYIHKETDQMYTPSYERDAIRPHALGKFRDLLLATAQHPAMLVYLDNWQSIGPDSVAAAAETGKAQRGLNENYGSEVMELHTVGVNGGYSRPTSPTWRRSSPDGPSISRNRAAIRLRSRKHEPGSKQWFGQKLRERLHRRPGALTGSPRSRRQRTLSVTNWPSASSPTIRPRNWSTAWRRPTSPLTETSKKSSVPWNVRPSSGRASTTASR